MKEQFSGQTKMDIAKKILIHVTDSISKANPKVEFGLRVLGHQFPREQNNCKDTKLEVPFTKNNSAMIAAGLNKINPQGQTPLAYSLFQSLNDFPNDSIATNAIILITDGVETCGGDLCALSPAMQKKRIAMKPFIVGMGMNPDTGLAFFKCIGTFYNTFNESSMNNVMNALVSQALNNTSVQINLMSAYGQPTETNVTMTFYDHATHKTKYNFVHTLNGAGIPDTLFLDPIGHYDIVVHSIPEVKKEDIELIPGKHNLIAIDVPQGSLSLKMDVVGSGYSPVQCIVREMGSSEILCVQDLKTVKKYLTGNYDLEILTTPRIYLTDVSITQSKTNEIKIAQAGILNVSPTLLGSVSVMQVTEFGMTKVWDFHNISSLSPVELQPGNYVLIFRSDKGKQSINTKQIPFTITSGKTTLLKP